MIALLLGCGQIGVNNPPKLVSFNGYAVRDFNEAERDPVNHISPGEHYTFFFEVSDPEGHDVRAWWPWAPAGVVLDPDEREGSWTVPDDLERGNFRLILQDTHKRDPRASSWWLPLSFYSHSYDYGYR